MSLKFAIGHRSIQCELIAKMVYQTDCQEQTETLSHTSNLRRHSVVTCSYLKIIDSNQRSLPIGITSHKFASLLYIVFMLYFVI